jgi:hypothetical protein
MAKRGLKAGSVLGLPLFFICHGWTENVLFIPPLDALLLLAQYLLASVCLWLFFSWFFRSADKGALASVATLFFYFFFGAFRDTLLRVAPETFLVKYSVQLPVWTATWLCILWFIRKREPRSVFFYYLVSLFGVLILYDGFLAVHRIASRRHEAYKPACSRCEKPDVYLIVFDGYAGLEQLDSDFNYNNRPFLDSLRSLGFYVMPGSRSNYTSTAFSIASIFQMQYLQLSNDQFSESNQKSCYGLIYDNPVARRFQSEGYDIVNYSFFDLKGAPAISDNSFLVSGAALISSQTLGQRLKRDLYNNIVRKHFPGTRAYDRLVFANHRDNLLFSEMSLQTAGTESKRPRFVYVHLEMPHAPYYFREDGKLNVAADLTAENLERKDLYLGYLKYTNRYMIDFIRKLQRNDAGRSAYLILGDHGFRNSDQYSSYHSVLGAIHLPAAHYSAYTDSVSHVNQFRLLFNNLFRDSLTLLPHREF